MTLGELRDKLSALFEAEELVDAAEMDLSGHFSTEEYYKREQKVREARELVIILANEKLEL